MVPKESKAEEPEQSERIVHQVGKIGIGQFAYGWFVCKLPLTKRGRLRLATFHPNLALACEAAALRVADDAQAKSLTSYAKTLRAAVAEIKVAIAAAKRRTCNEENDLAPHGRP